MQLYTNLQEKRQSYAPKDAESVVYCFPHCYTNIECTCTFLYIVHCVFTKKSGGVPDKLCVFPADES
jgi:hypothetical protein